MPNPTPIRFPFPNPKLSPNKRMHHLYLTKVRDDARQIGYWIAKDAGWKFSGKNNLEICITICPPDKRRRDDDNIYAAFKSYRDGIFKALELDDSLIHRTVLERGPVEKDGALYITLPEINK